MVPVPERDFTSAKSVALITPLEGSEGPELIIDTDSPQQITVVNATARTIGLEKNISDCR
jgi:hypothetical protein